MSENPKKASVSRVGLGQSGNGCQISIYLVEDGTGSKNNIPHKRHDACIAGGQVSPGHVEAALLALHVVELPLREVDDVVGHLEVQSAGDRLQVLAVGAVDGEAHEHGVCAGVDSCRGCYSVFFSALPPPTPLLVPTNQSPC